jgi:hypothetical protein
MTKYLPGAMPTIKWTRVTNEANHTSITTPSDLKNCNIQGRGYRMVMAAIDNNMTLKANSLKRSAIQQDENNIPVKRQIFTPRSNPTSSCLQSFSPIIGSTHHTVHAEQTHLASQSTAGNYII